MKRVKPGEQQEVMAIRARIIAHNTPKQWHDMSPEFFERADLFCCRSKADLWIQRYDGKPTLSSVKAGNK